MRQKKDWRDSLLTLAVLLSLFRGDIDDYMRGSFANLPEVHEILLGQSAALTETQFHNLFNSIEGHSSVHPKNLDIDWHHRSAFADLHTLYRDSSQNSREITAFLLDRLEPNAGRPYPFVNLVQNSNGNAGNNAVNTDSENNNDNNNNVDGASSAPGSGNLNDPNLEDGILGAVAAPPIAELSPEDMDLIGSLWRQDMDMGFNPEDVQSFGYKSKLLDKPDHPEKLKQPEAWERYNIDGEPGEFVPIPFPFQLKKEVLSPHQLQQHQPSQTTENNLSLEECLQLIDQEYTPTVNTPTESSPTFQPELNPVEAEQRWRDLASIPELYQLQSASTEAMQFPAHQEGTGTTMMNMTHPVVENPFMVNVTTNGNVNLQNATNISGQTLERVDNQVLQPSSMSPHEIPPQHPEVFSPLSNFANLSLNAGSPSAINDQSLNLSNLLAPGSFPHGNLTADSGSILSTLLSEGVEDISMDYDEQIHSLVEAFEEDSIDDSDSGRGSRSPFDLSDAASPVSDNGSAEGATGYNSSLESEATGGYVSYHRGRGSGRQYGGDNPRKDSFSNNFSHQPPKMEHVTHNHTYAGSSGSHNSNGNGSRNGTSKSEEQEERERLSRDERRAKALKIPIGIEKVINLPVDAFNEVMKKYDLNDAQTALIRDIRRRGKNKVAAQNCRKRKIDAIMGIEHTIHSLRADKDKLVRERDMIDKETMEMRDRYTQLYNDIFQNLRDESGDPVDPNEFTLQQMPDGTMFLVPRNGTSTQKEDDNTDHQ
ncbi:endoplasmic reticulum membrane sensor NFE2L1-like [Amphiura filiformis]|uniref:endoplasmic reticulum membrane sensor NFE2L1-like n=1 Tax=Amphiura filiformis TaxID=82378 RepID=UPI003B211BBB